jgi:hypothetical protein
MARFDWFKEEPNNILRRAVSLSLAHDFARYFSLLRTAMAKTDIMNKSEPIYNADKPGCHLNNKPRGEVRFYTP